MKNQALVFEDPNRKEQDTGRVFQSLFDAKFVQGSVPGVKRGGPQAAVGLIASSPVGPVLVCVSGRGIAMIRFLKQVADLEAATNTLSRNFDLAADDDGARRVADEIGRFMAGDETALRSRIDLSLIKAPFQRRVLELLQEVGPGAILTYASLGAWAGAPKAPRAIGGAMHDNPVPVYVPCHRVVRSDLSLGGYGGGLDVKRKLLEVEGFSFTATGRVAEGGAVWGNRDTRIFCRPRCRALARTDRTNMLLFRHEERAERAGMRACSICGGKRGK